MSKVTVVILNYNGKHYLEKFLPGVIERSADATIVVADNCSTDDSVSWMGQHHPNIRLILLSENKGYSGGYNEALKQIDSEYLVLLNSDVDVTAYWIDPLLQLLEENAEVAACQPKILDYNNPKRFEYAGAAGGYIDSLAYPFCRGRVFQTLEEDLGQYDTSREVFWASGACLFIRAGVFNQLGGFDEDFFAHMEEIDLCWRIHGIGYKIYCQPESTVYHVGGGTLSQTSPIKTYLNFRNGLSMLLKNVRSGLVGKLTLRIILDVVAAFKFLVAGSPQHFAAVLKAHFHFYGRWQINMEKRRELKRKELRDSSVVYNGILPLAYFLRGKRKFPHLIN